MGTKSIGGLGLLLAIWASSAAGEDVIWRASQPQTAPAPSPPVVMGRPQPLDPPPPLVSPPPAAPARLEIVPVVRGQSPDPPPVFPGASPGTPAPGFVPAPPGNLYNQGAVNNDSDLGGFWTRTGDGLKRCWDDITGNAGGMFQGGPGHQPFQSDHTFDYFSSPVTNPFYAIDPRSLTEIRPEFIWQHTPSSNPVWNGGNNFVFAAAGSVAFTQNLSLVVNKVGFYSIDPKSPSPLSSDTGFSDVLLGPKLTFLRSETSKTVAAIGLTFDIPAGSSRNLQDTGHLMLDPYLSIAQNFGQSSYGSFNFMNTTGYNFRTDNTRTESLYSSFHLDYDVGQFHRFYPMVELNWWLYTRNGGNEPVNFDGSNLANFGSQHVAGLNELTVAVGTRVVITKNIQWGIGLEFDTLPNGDGRHLDQFRLTTDFIFRY